MNKSLWERVEESGIVRAEVTIRKSRSPRDRIWVLEVAECPYCGKRHEHGGGSVEGPPALGFRAPHCFRRVAPGDYELVERAPKEQPRDQ